MARSPLDDLDKQILYHLQEDARANVTQIANEVEVSGNTVRNRIEQLEDRGVIKGYSVDIDYGEAGLDLHFAFECTTRVSERGETVRETLDIPGVIEAREFMTGQKNIYLEGVGTDTEDITRVAQNVDTLGAEINVEKLVRNDYSRPFTSFGELGDGSEE